MFFTGGGEEAHALMDATMLGQTSIVISLLREGADPNPNFGSHKGRLGKVSNRLQRRAEFSSMPIHGACTQGYYELIKALRQFGSKCSAPDASAKLCSTFSMYRFGWKSRKYSKGRRKTRRRL